MTPASGGYYYHPRPMPRSVRYACGLLSLQAVLWAVAAAGLVGVWTARVNWQPHAHSPWQLAGWILAGNLAFALVAGLASGSAFLAASLGRGRRIARFVAVLLEAGLACFGVLSAHVTAISGGGIIAMLPVLAGLGGAALSLAAAVGLLFGSARRFTRDHPLAS